MSKNEEIKPLQQHDVVCSACKNPLMEWEIPKGEINKNDIECIDCEMKQRDSADIDNLMGCS